MGATSFQVFDQLYIGYRANKPPVMAVLTTLMLQMLLANAN